jgi:hypothetical protein
MCLRRDDVRLLQFAASGHELARDEQWNRIRR